MKSKIVKIISNKYFIATVVFLVLIVFVDEYSLRVSSRLKRQVGELYEEEEQLKQDITQDSIAAAELRNNIDAKEHYARENYYMKRPNEDIFVIK